MGETPTFPEELEEAPETPNAYGDGSMKNPGTQAWSLAGFGVWWPGEKLTDHFKATTAEAKYTHWEEKPEGVGQ